MNHQLLAIVTLISGVVGLIVALYRHRRRERAALRYLPFDEPRGRAARRLGKYDPRWRSERGQTVVEVAMGVTIILFLFLAATSVGLTLLNEARVEHAARESAIALTTGTTDIGALVAEIAPEHTQVVSFTPCSGAGTQATVVLSLDATETELMPLPSFPSLLQARGVAICTA
ncbi:MAG: TadE family protein [Candidatus Binatus sp.]|uniref:TadE/TadG family type IV pilus assembly protein n=1 Tax=Candidatus Binatus sp. TaxID=2811406 RepID=UPI003C7194CD